MAEVARDEFGLTLRWVEPASRDTHENAVDTLALLQPAGVREVVLVTHGAHMPRALREFRAAAAAQSASTPDRDHAGTDGPGLAGGWLRDALDAFGRGLERMQLAAARGAGPHRRPPLTAGHDEAPIT